MGWVLGGLVWRGCGDETGGYACSFWIEEDVTDIEDEKWLGKFEFCGEDWGTRPELLVNGWVAKGSKALRSGFWDMTRTLQCGDGGMNAIK